MVVKFKTEFKAPGDPEWCPGVDGTEAQCRTAANRYWQSGADAVRIIETTTRVVVGKSRSR